METEDGRIIQECLNGEKEAFGVLIDKYREGIYAYIYAKLGDFHEAQDVTQEVFLKAYQGLRSLKKRESFAFWLYRIAYSRCGQWLRDRAKRIDRDFIEDQSPEAMDSPSLSSYRDEQLNESIRETLDLLPGAYREVLVLHYFAGMSSDEMAVSLGTSPTAIRMRLSRARSLLKEEMIDMMGRAFAGQQLPMGFTFRIVEAVKRTKIQPTTPRSSGLPWGLSLATGIIITILSLNPYLSIPSSMSDPAGAPLPVKAKVLKAGEIPVDIMKVDEISVISNKQKNDGGGEPKNSFMLAPHGQGTWSRKADMPTSRNRHSSCVVDEKIYAIGGIGGFWWNVASIEEYNPVTDKWIKKTDMPTPRHGLAASVVNGIIYTFGGMDNSMTACSTVEAYNPAMDIWEKKADMPTARGYPAASVVNGKIYVIGGWQDDPAAAGISTVEEYDPETNIWTNKADMPTARSGFSTSVVDDKIYAIGGVIVNRVLAPTVEEYDPATDTWTKKVDMPAGRGRLSTSVVDDKIYAIGGLNDGFWGISTVEVYDPTTDLWTKETDMPTARGFLSSATVDGKIYIIGGGTGGGNCAPFKEGILEEFDPRVTSQGKHVGAEEKLPTKWGETKSH